MLRFKLIFGFKFFKLVLFFFSFVSNNNYYDNEFETKGN